MDHLQTITNFVLVSFSVTALWAPLLIALLYRFDIVIKNMLMSNNENAEFIRIHGHKIGTPTLGGLMISITVGVLGVIFLPQGDLKNLFLVFWALFTVYGLIEGLLVYARKAASESFRKLEGSLLWRVTKIAVIYLLVLAALYFTVQTFGITELNLFGNVLQYQPWLLPVGAFIAVIAVFGIEITDGADALVTGQFLVQLVAFLAIAVITGHVELLPIISLILGSTLVYLYFNINPARVFMGGTGTFPIAFTLIFLAVLSNTVDILIIMGAIFWAEVASSGLQLLSIKFLKRKLFRIAPIHHHFEAIGWPETKMVQRFSWAAMVLAFIGLWVLALTR